MINNTELKNMEPSVKMDSMRTRRANRTGGLIRKPNGTYLAKWTGTDGKIHYKAIHETTYSKAVKVLDTYTQATRQETIEDQIKVLEMQLEILRGKLRKPELFISDIWTEYDKTQWESDITANTKKGYESSIHQLETWMRRNGCRYVSDITKEKAEDYLKFLQSSIGLVSYNCRLVLFKRVWKELSNTGKFNLDENLWTEFQKLKGAKHVSKRRPLTDAEIKSLLEQADDDMRLLVKIGINTGLRLGDCACLKWSDVDMEKRLISTIPQKTKKHGTKVIIPIRQELYAELLKVEKTGEYVNAKNAHAYSTGHIQDSISTLFEKAGITTSEIDEQGKRHTITGFHSLRHTFVSKAVNSGISPMLIKDIVGHSSIDMTSHYHHTDIETTREMFNKVA